MEVGNIYKTKEDMECLMNYIGGTPFTFYQSFY